MPPGEPRRLVVGLTVAEAALTLLLLWVLLRTNVFRDLMGVARFDVSGVVTLGSIAACLAMFLFVLGVWQWRLRGRDRVRVLLATYMGLVPAFCAVCWYDVSVRTAELASGPAAPSALEQVLERSGALILLMTALLAGLVAVTVVLWLARRSLSADSRDAIVGDGQQG